MVPDHYKSHTDSEILKKTVYLTLCHDFIQRVHSMNCGTVPVHRGTPVKVYPEQLCRQILLDF